jgi:hypothetical protein
VDPHSVSLAFQVNFKTSVDSRYVILVPKTQRVQTLTQQNATFAALVNRVRRQVPNVTNAMLVRQERRVCHAKQESIDQQKLSRVKKQIQRSVCLVQKVDTKINKVKHHAYPAFLGRMKTILVQQNVKIAAKANIKMQLAMTRV